MNDTVIYLIRHADTVEENGIRNTNENSQMINEKEILSIKGEEQSKKLSENTELQNLDVIWTSNYTRAKATAKYIAYKNNLQYNIDKRLSERKLGNMDDLANQVRTMLLEHDGLMFCGVPLNADDINNIVTIVTDATKSVLEKKMGDQ